MKCETLDIASTMLDMKLQPVRLRVKSKSPVEEGWPKRIHTHESVGAEFECGENVGVLLGELGGWVVDIDLDSMKAVEVAQRILPPTLTFGRDGKPRSHYLYRCTGCPTVKRKVSDGLVELRSTGHQTMYVGSIHPNGERVRMESPAEAIRDIASHELLHLVDRIARECGWEPAERKVERVEPVRVSGGGYGAAALRGELSLLAATQEGGRNDQLNRSAFAVRQLIDTGELPPAAMEEVRMVALSIGLDAREIDATIRSAESGATGNPRAPRAMQQPQTMQQPPAKVTRDQAQALADGGVAEMLRMLASTQGRTVAGIPIPGYPVLTDALFGLSGTCLLTGPSGMGKTTLVNGIALNVARGRCDATGESGTPFPVVYVSAEMSRGYIVASMVQQLAGISARTLQLGEQGGIQHPGTMTEHLLLHDRMHKRVEDAVRTLDELERSRQLVVCNAAHMMRPWTRGEHALIGLQETVEALHPDGALVIIDTLATLGVQPAEGQRHGSDLDTDADIVDALVRWRESLGARSAILAVHEESKAATGTGDGHAVRGSSRYLYSTTQRIAMVSASSDEGTRGMGLRRGDVEEGVQEIDMVISKARFGGKAHTIVAMSHRWQEGVVREHAPLFTLEEIREAKKEKAVAKKEQAKANAEAKERREAQRLEQAVQKVMWQGKEQDRNDRRYR